MNYPNITLTIKNQIPSIHLHQSAERSKKIASAKVGIDTFLMQVCDQIGYTHNDDLQDIYSFMHDGDWGAIKFKQLDLSADQINFAAIMEIVKAEADNYEHHPAADSQALKDQMLTDWQTDILAGALEEIYNLLIGKTFYLASELAVDTIVLDDERQDTRLREKMSKELGMVEEIEFLLAEQE